MNKPNPNPYLQKRPGKVDGAGMPLLVKLPIHDFRDAHHLEAELLRYEQVIARIPNPRATGFTHNVALVYKDDMDRVYSLQMMQHHGVLKDTPENAELFAKKVKGEAPDGESETPQQDNSQGKESPVAGETEGSPES